MRWLQDFVDIPWKAHELAHRLTRAGAKVEGVHSLDHDYSGVVVGRIVERAPHPDSDTLTVCRVDVGGRQVQAVTGAPNVREGLLVPVALPGASLPGLGSAVAEVTVRGVRSEAVLCSERELGISDDHSGVMELPGDLVPGQALTEALALDDAVLEIEVYPNRPDHLSVYGIAREVAAITGAQLRQPETAVAEADERVEEAAKVEVLDPDLCPRYIARVIRGVRIGPSPAWLQQRLRAAGMRPINNVVDVTNYVMLELGQPLHAFDYHRVSGRKIVVRRARPGERITTLDGQERDLDPEMLLICDAERPVAVAGVMGGEDSEVRPETTDILLESANFNAVSIRKTSKRLGLRTEASYRFERDLDPHLAEVAADRAARLIQELAGGKVLRGRIDVAAPLPPPREITLRVKRVCGMLGVQLSPAEIKRILRGLGFGVELEKDASVMTVRVPTYRRDIEGEADLVEEVARIYGYDEIEPTLPAGAGVLGKLSWPLPAVEKVRSLLSSLGLFEAISYSFISPKAFDRLRIPADHPMRRAIELANPLTEEHSVMRTSLLPGLVDAIALNVRRQVPDIRLFEVGKVYIPDALPLESLPSEKWTLGIAVTGEATTNVWGAPIRPVDFYDLKGIVEALLEELGLAGEFLPGEHPALHPGRTARLTVSGQEVGWLGELHPKVAAEIDLRGRAYLAEIDLESLFALEPRAVAYTPLPRYPTVERDLALLVPRSVAAASVAEVIRREGGPYLRDVALFDVYEGKQVPEGYRSLAYTMTYRADDRTLTDEEIAEAQARIEAALGRELGVSVRG